MNSHLVNSGLGHREAPAPRSMPHAYQQGGTLLLVEDSRLFSDTIRAVMRGTGGRIRRTDTLCGARRHLSLYTPDVVMIDLGLPDGSGLELIAECARRSIRVPLIIAISGQPELESAAYTAGADKFFEKPIVSLSQFRAALAPSCFDMDAMQAAAYTPLPDVSALRDDLYLALDLLQGPDQSDRRQYALQFCEGLARSLHDVEMQGAVAATKSGGGAGRLVEVLRKRLNAQPLV
ncbi:response regulator receiver domain-containing protein [Roseinatronobacter bogoriensis subsp. barguzinensis]|uniref:Response regulator n=2 Tax=Roseinatronobacter bogoriensis TaxID=119542 RepID=A0A2K8KD40_9RHOB|nr:response regulator [Rhodobaca barguzinensis]MBB4206933.1 CheY-like chemotaxis protein [Rhodobaca bogoriensis DSM 18756]TDW41676.1 response regulator receiver domain-containing protein [Rhodobaca barguzinensis]TDY74145.1 response regulator receiver domain-containing protein [Rhodobaca bogoriensis DSM 18756]